MNISATTATPFVSRNWLKRASALGFWFFMIKGLLWLAAPLVFYVFV